MPGAGVNLSFGLSTVEQDANRHPCESSGQPQPAGLKAIADVRKPLYKSVIGTLECVLPAVSGIIHDLLSLFAAAVLARYRRHTLFRDSKEPQAPLGDVA
jgi:hypothetical protein